MTMFSDGHCDYLYKVAKDETTVVNPFVLKESKVIMQNFAIFADPITNHSTLHYDILTQIKIFKKNVSSIKEITLLTNNYQIDDYMNNKQTNMMALLSIEGCDAINSSNNLFNTLWSAGVRIYGLTWNKDNHFATSCTTMTKNGLSKIGKEFVYEIANKDGVVDVSHISERAFWDIIDVPNNIPAIVASHSNCKTICNHKRNLTDNQIKAIIERNGVIGINFVPMFLSNNCTAGIEDVIKHIERILELGGHNNVAIGSDFDGAKVIDELSTPKKLMNLANALNKKYDETIVTKITHLNWLRFLKKYLPN